MDHRRENRSRISMALIWTKLAAHKERLQRLNA
jgi:hypothetical protein